MLAVGYCWCFLFLFLLLIFGFDIVMSKHMIVIIVHRKVFFADLALLFGLVVFGNSFAVDLVEKDLIFRETVATEFTRNRCSHELYVSNIND